MHTTGTGLVEIQAVAEIPGLNVTAGGNIGCATAVYGQIAVVGACNAVNPDGAVGAGLVHAFHLSSRIPAGLVVPPPDVLREAERLPAPRGLRSCVAHTHACVGVTR